MAATTGLTLPPGFDYRPLWLAASPAQDLLEALWREARWRQDRIRLFGKMVLQPRLTAWAADPGVHYRYSGLALGPAPWPQALHDLRTRLDADVGIRFNSLLMNAYRDGDDAMGWHADDEPELGPQPVIASLSLGAPRRFLVKPRHGGASLGLDLAHGSLLLMHGRSQADYRHAVPRTRRPAGLRINLTFRRVLRGPG